MSDDVVLVDPVLHVGPGDVVAFPFEQEGGDGAVHSARKRDEDFFGGRHFFDRLEDDAAARCVVK